MNINTDHTMMQGRDEMRHDHFHSISVLARNLQKVRETVYFQQCESKTNAKFISFKSYQNFGR